ncbi:uncharacterized protein JCM6883_002728 [Sporobolomyces salmoneus]|uniref:uncharacterized protein n=1 Tax=Sporobolomyces salmoneus TaxID=183962 RepID=UPI003177BC33
METSSKADVDAVLSELPPLPERTTAFSRFWANANTQVVLVSLVCFGCPGMFNALSGVGGGGQVDPKVNNDGNVALYSTFAVVGFFSGPIINRLGNRLALAIGASGYALYMGSLLNYNIRQTSGFVIAAGAILGVCAGLLWTAQGSLTLSYATEKTKGRLFALFWMIFNLGGVLGSAIELGLVYNSETNTVGNGVYIVFMTIAAAVSIVPATLVSPYKMVRSDGTRVIPPTHPTVKNQFIGLYKILRNDYLIFCLFPYFLASNWIYTYQFNSYNGAQFTLRGRALNSLLYWLANIVGAGLFGLTIDSTRFRRTRRAWGAFVFILCLGMATWGATYHYQRLYTRETVFDRIDIHDSGYAGRAVLYCVMGLYDSIFQNYIYWILGSLTNLPGNLSYLVGFYKGIQSAGAAGAYRADTNLQPYMSELGTAWGLTTAALVFAIPVLLFRIGDHTEEIVIEAKASPEVESVDMKKLDSA